jgi:thioredoxin-related protein
MFAEKTIPRAYLFDKQGKLIYASIGYTAEEFQKLMETIEKAL